MCTLIITVIPTFVFVVISTHYSSEGTRLHSILRNQSLHNGMPDQVLPMVDEGASTNGNIGLVMTETAVAIAVYVHLHRSYASVL